MCYAGAIGLVSSVLLVLSFCQYPVLADNNLNSASGITSNSPVVSWHEKGEQKGVAVLLHGISFHAGALKSVADQLAAHGIRTYALDLRGHGWWRFYHRKGDDGYDCDYKKSLDDACRLSLSLKRARPDLPVFVVGESVGAALALRVGTEVPAAVDGLLLCGVGARTCHAKPAWVVSDAIKGMLKRPINILRYQRKYGSDDPVDMEETLSDPEIRKTFSLGELLQTRSIIKKNYQFARSLDSDIAVLVIQGSDDHVLTSKSAKRVFAAIPGSDKRFVMVPHCGHVLLGTHRVKPLVLNSIVSFINQHPSRQFRSASVDIPRSISNRELAPVSF